MMTQDQWRVVTDRDYGEPTGRGRPRTDHRGRGPRGYVRSDERIEEEIHARLTDDPSVDGTEIEVSVRDGEVTLSGSVAGRFERRRAEDIVDQVSGVRHVRNDLRPRDRRPWHGWGGQSAAEASGGYGTTARSATGTSGEGDDDPGYRRVDPTQELHPDDHAGGGRLTEPRGASGSAASQHALSDRSPS